MSRESGSRNNGVMHAVAAPIIPSASGASTLEAAQTLTLQVAGLHCAACADLLRARLQALPGVRRAGVGYAAALAWVEFDPARVDLAALQAVGSAAGYELVPAQPEAAAALRRREARAMLWRLFVAWFCMMQVMMLAAPTYFASGAEVPPDLRALLHGASWVLSLPVLLFSAGPFLRGAWRSLQQRRLGMDVPVALGLLLTFGASTLALADPAGALGDAIYLDSFTMFVAFLLAARWLELRARHAAAESLEALGENLPAKVLRWGAPGQWEQVDRAALLRGDRVQVALGEIVPADGRLLQGQALVDEALLSGEARPVARPPGALLVAGSVNLGGPIVLEVEALGEQTRQAALGRLLQQALTERPAWSREADRWAPAFLFLVLLLAAAAGLAWWWLEPARALGVVAAVLVVTCPCALALAAPAALVASARALAARGIWLQRLPALERLAGVNHVVLDKTGTLTEPVVRVPPDTDPELLAAAVGLAQWSRHPLAKALARLPLDRPAWRWTEAQEQPGQGLRARDPQGRWGWLGRAPDGAAPLAFGQQDSAQRLDFQVDEQPRRAASASLARLRGLGLKLSLLSGDRPERVRLLAQQLGLTHARGACSPEDKRAAVQALQAGGDCVLMVGDGLNDAPVLAQADASVALGEGAGLARQGADFTLLHNELNALPELLLQARRTRGVMRQNLAWAVGYNLLAVPLALSGQLAPWAAGLGMALSSLLVVANALRLARV